MVNRLIVILVLGVVTLASASFAGAKNVARFESADSFPASSRVLSAK